MTYGCYNREPFETARRVQDGHKDNGPYFRQDRMVYIKDPMTKDCQYTHTDLGKKDNGCNGCKWRAT